MPSNVIPFPAVHRFNPDTMAAVAGHVAIRKSEAHQCLRIAARWFRKANSARSPYVATLAHNIAREHIAAATRAPGYLGPAQEAP